jgi:hypothetical protein
LDLPSQRTLLAQYRIDEIAASVHASFTSSTKTFRPLLESGHDADLEEMASLLAPALEHAMEEFDTLASRYDPTVYDKKRDEFWSRCTTVLETHYDHLLRVATQRSLSTFKRRLESECTENAQFLNVVEMIRRDVEEAFARIAKGELEKIEETRHDIDFLMLFSLSLSLSSRRSCSRYAVE